MVQALAAVCKRLQQAIKFDVQNAHKFALHHYCESIEMAPKWRTHLSGTKISTDSQLLLLPRKIVGDFVL